MVSHDPQNMTADSFKLSAGSDKRINIDNPFPMINVSVFEIKNLINTTLTYTYLMKITTNTVNCLNILNLHRLCINA